MKNNVDKKEHLPFIGVGPIIVIPQLAVTAVAITLSEMKNNVKFVVHLSPYIL